MPVPNAALMTISLLPVPCLKTSSHAIGHNGYPRGDTQGVTGYSDERFIANRPSTRQNVPARQAGPELYRTRTETRGDVGKPSLYTLPQVSRRPVGAIPKNLVNSMSSQPSKVARLLDLLAFLSTRRFPVSGAELLSQLPGYRDSWVDGTPVHRDSVRRKFERDKRELRSLGVPLKVETKDGGEEFYYSLRDRDFYLPVLEIVEGTEPVSAHQDSSVWFSPGDLRMVVDGLRSVVELPGFPLRREARAALRKLTFDLVEAAGDDEFRVLHLPPFDPHHVRETLEKITASLEERRPLGFEYYTIGADRREDRTVHPRGLLYQGSRWYLVAWDPSRGAERLFRVDRMSRVEPKGSSPVPAFEIPADYSMDHLRRRDPWELGETEVEEVAVLFHAPLSLLAERNRWGEPVGTGEEQDMGLRTNLPGGGPSASAADVVGGAAIVRRFQVRSSGPFLRWILSLGGRARILAPTTLTEAAEAMRQRILEVHR